MAASFDTVSQEWLIRFVVHRVGDRRIIRLIEFGRHAAARREQRRLGKPETFNFLGVTFISGKDRRGGFQLRRKTRRDRMTAKLLEVKEELRRRMHRPIPEQGQWLTQVLAAAKSAHKRRRVPFRSRDRLGMGPLSGRSDLRRWETSRRS